MSPTPRILLVDDHGRFRSSLRDWLEHHLCRVEVLEAASGEEAVRVAALRRPDLVLMDIGLPGMDGLEATRRIQRHRPSTVVVIVSLHATERHRAESAAAGAAAHVAKGSLPDGLEGPLDRLLSPRAEDDHIGPIETGRTAPTTGGGK